LTIVQKEHLNGQPRPASKVARNPALRAMTWRGNQGTGCFSSPGKSFT
jgi:hypothetical protein